MNNRAKKSLEIKHLAPYLPYGLNWYIEGMQGPEIMTMIGLSNGHVIFSQMDLEIMDSLDLDEHSALNPHKPALRPLSDLTKEIEHNGKKYCVMSLWYSVPIKDEENYKLYGTIPDYWKTVINVMTRMKFIDYGFVKIMFEHHFDVFGLIDSGLALDINTIEK